MSPHYSAEELLHLRDSPLVRKPDGLPPPEQWMGSPVEKAAVKPVATRPKLEDGQSFPLPADRRSAPFDARHTTRGPNSVPDDIVLGPPKMSFASATAIRSVGRASDAATSGSSSIDPDTTRLDQLNSRDRSFKEKEILGRDSDRTRDGRSGTLNGRRGAKEDQDGWTAVKSRNSFGHEDGERYSRRNTDRDRDKGPEIGRDGRERERPPRTFDTFTRDKENEAEKDGTPRRNGVPRGRNESSWFKEKEAPGLKEKDVREGARDREWRERDRHNERNSDRANDRGVDRRHEERGAWNRGGRAERDPEWMDTPAPEEQKQAHTAEDFQRWKERMKAGSSTPAEERPKLEGHGPPDASRTTPSAVREEHKASAPIVMDSEIDNFFGMWNEPRPGSNGPPGLEPMQVSSGKEAGKSTVGRASRFTSFFSPAEEARQPQSAPPAEPVPPATSSRDASDQDKEGFQRILQMLGGASLGAEKPGPAMTRGPRLEADRQASAPPELSHRNFLEAREDHRQLPSQMSHDSHHLHSRSSAEVGNLLSMPPTDHGHPSVAPNRDHDFLLGLMQHGPPPTSEGHLVPNTMSMNPGNFNPGLVGPPGWMGHVGQQGNNHKAHPPGLAPGFPPGFDPAAIAALPRRRGEPPVGPPPAPNMLQRPPGFEQMIPGWAPGPAPPGQVRSVLPPPGFNPDGHLGHPPFPPFLPGPNGMPFFRSPVGPGGPPGMPSIPPPPGFFGLGPPMPGYPSMPFQPDVMMSMPGRPALPPFDPYAADANQVGRGRGAPPGF